MKIDRNGFNMSDDETFLVCVLLFFVILFMTACSHRQYPVTPSASKAQKAQQSQIQSNFP